MTGAGSVARSAVRALNRTVAGDALHRSDLRFGEASASPFANLEIVWDPEVVVSAAQSSDVQAATRFARDHGLVVAVRGGGVGWTGAPPGTVLLDLRRLGGIEVDAERSRVRAQAGSLWRDVQRELGTVDLAGAGPQFPLVGVAGYALGGGRGWLSGKLGWGADTLVAVDMVTADGDLVRADEVHEPDLFWALRGAGHNFGVAVSLELTAVPLEAVTFGAIWFSPEHLADALELYRDWVVDTPDELTTVLGVVRPPADLPIADEHRGRVCCQVMVCHCGTEARAAEDLARLRRHPHVIASTVKRAPWSAVATTTHPLPPNIHMRANHHYIGGMSDDVIATTIERADAMSPLSFMTVHHYGGAMTRVDEHATAMSHRGQAWNYMVTTRWMPDEDAERMREWHSESLDRISLRATGAAYVNYLYDEPERVQSAYNADAWTRLCALKSEWDAGNLFSVNQNIPPAPKAERPRTGV